MTSSARTVTANLEIDPCAATPRGALCSELGRLEFSGWTELAVAIEEWRTRVCGEQPLEGTSSSSTDDE